MALPGRSQLARILILAVALSGLPAAAAATPAAPGAATPEAQPPGVATAARRDAFVPGRVLVRFQAAAGERGRRTAAAAVDGRVGAGHGRTRLVELDRDADVRAAARRLAGRPEVAFAEPDWIRRVDACAPSVCWQLQPRPGANVVAAHRAGARGEGRTVAVVDTGVATGVADLAGRVQARWRCDPGCTRLDPAAPDTAQDPQDPADPLTLSHGTEVASVVAANDDDLGATGVAPLATIVSYRVDSAVGIPVSYVESALLHIAADPSIDVVNLSLSGSQWSEFERGAIDAVLAAGKTVVAAAGNFGNRLPQYPAAFPGVISVGATDDLGRPAPFSSYGKVDMVAPGVCVAVAEVAGFVRGDGCGDGPAGAAFASGTSFAAPVVAGLLALAGARGPLPARLVLEASADNAGAGGLDAKRRAHGLVDAGALVDAERDGGPSLVLETSARDAEGRDHAGSGDGQLPHPATSFVAYAFRPGGELASAPGPAELSGEDDGDLGTAPFREVDGEPGVFAARLDAGPLRPGAQQVTAAAIMPGGEETASVTVLGLYPDDQAPGVELVGDGDDAWRRLDRVDDSDLDDVYAVTLGRGDRLEAAVEDRSPDPVGLLLLKPGTVDVAGEIKDQAVACGGAFPGCPTATVRFEAPARGTYLLDVLSTGPTGDYRLTWTVRNAAGLPIAVPVPACSPDGDGVQDRCAWTADTIPGWTTSSFVTRGAVPVRRQAGAGEHGWDGRDEDGEGQADGDYLLRVLYTEPGGRALLSVFELTLDRRPPSIAAATAAPNPFEPRPADGDRDTTTFAMTSSEPGRLRVLIYRSGGTAPVRVLVSGTQPAGRQRIAWSGRTAAGAWLRGRFAYVIEAGDAAGNTASSQRHRVQVL
jgi:hypothetical protein